MTRITKGLIVPTVVSKAEPLVKSEDSESSMSLSYLILLFR